MSGSLRAVLFDVDGTLVDTNYLHAVTWWQAFAQGGQLARLGDSLIGQANEVKEQR